MTLGSVTGSDDRSAVSFCSCCGAKMVPDLGDDAVVSKNQINQLISESFLTVKGAALFLPRGKSPAPNSGPRSSQRRNKHTGDLQKHLQTMFTVLRPEDNIRLAVRLESAYPQVTRYMVVVSTNGRQDTEESVVLGIDFVSSDSCCTVGMVLPLWSDTMIHLDGDGGFSVSTVNRVHVFKPVSVQAMWSALQSLHKACEVARCHNYYPGSLFLTWVSYYQSRVSSSQFCINEWNAMQDVESYRANSPILFTDLPTERERTERLIRMRLREIMMQKDLENVTCKEIRTELEIQMVCNLREFKEFIDNEMIIILGQMDSPTEIFDHVFLGSEWNASNLEELQSSGVRYILNVTREIDNFFPGMFEYHNIRVYDEEATNLLEYWNETYKFITKAKKAGVKVLVHCKMGVSRSASTVIAYAMKEYGWDLDTAFDYVKERRAVTKPNPSFMKQLEEYQGILLASKQRHNKLWRSHSDSELSDRPGSICKAPCPSLVRADSHNNNTSTSLHHFLGVAVLQALGAESEESGKSDDAHISDSHTLSAGSCESLLQGELLSESGKPVVLPLPRPRAATVIPEERLDCSASVAVTVPVALPHPPPALLILPPTPQLQRVRRSPPSHLPLSGPKRKPTELLLNLPNGAAPEDICSLSLGSGDSDSASPSVSDKSSETYTPLSPDSPTTLPASDDNNNLSELHTGSSSESRGEADGSSNHSADSIDFFTAREKFLGLAQDGQIQTPSEQLQQKTPPSSDGEEEASEEDEQGNGKNQDEVSDHKIIVDQSAPNHHDNGISVRHIVTEIEAISNPSTSPHITTSSSSSLSVSSQSSQLLRLDLVEEVEPPKAMHIISSSPLVSTVPRDRPAGSVRRATEQLEQKIKQERSPLQSPSAEHAPVRLSPSPRSPEPPPVRSAPPPELRTTRGETTAVCAAAKSKDVVEQTASHSELNPTQRSRPSSPPSSQVPGAEPKTVHTSKESCVGAPSLTPTSPLKESLQDTSTHSQRRAFQALQCPAASQAVSHKVSVHGVTLQESHTDERSDSGPQGRGAGCEALSSLARSTQELECIQQTLQELQAFLHEGVSTEQEPEQPQRLRDAMDTEPEGSKGQSSEASPSRHTGERRGHVEQMAWPRALELEARIRQAGLTTPSLMKRSASLAKLDFLELSANDLSDLDLRPHARTRSHPQNSHLVSQSHPDDAWKKQKVLSQSTASSNCDTPSPPPPRLSAHDNSKDDKGEADEADGRCSPASRQQGRGHARRSRRAAEKKRAAALMYNTM
ncbi:protein phosphatase Slingshot homolog 2 isoform X1 [Oryzias latipes]|uniref:protein-serine/threonine phosphatase n=1 Tax=Oryzias latipes TaxID=8090 RepID=H2MFQ7_ORYLA|nr:protein phosphatase Slingshot homolog 2 isoform X1 [Oryzias latipes]